MPVPSATSRRHGEYRRALEGHTDDLETIESNIIRVFFSSNATDFTVEKTYLMRNAVEKLKLFCQERGWEFQVVDLRFGASENLQFDHTANQLCLEQIANCRKISRGPFYVGFLGDKYGYRPYPKHIEVVEFNTIMEAAKSAKMNTDLLNDWFKLDTNAKPECFTLQPITSILTYFGDQSPINEQNRKKDESEWKKLNLQLGKILRVGANISYQHNQLTKEQWKTYTLSALQREMEAAFLGDPLATAWRTLCICRTLTDITHRDKRAGRYTDFVGGHCDRECVRLLAELRNVSLPSALPENNILNFTIPWRPTGVEANYGEHIRYLRKLSEIFYDRMVEEIQLVFDACHSVGVQNKALYHEVVQQGVFLNQMSARFYGRDELIERVRIRLDTVYDKKGEHVGINDNGIIKGTWEDNENENGPDEVWGETKLANDISLCQNNQNPIHIGVIHGSANMENTVKNVQSNCNDILKHDESSHKHVTFSSIAEHVDDRPSSACSAEDTSKEVESPKRKGPKAFTRFKSVTKDLSKKGVTLLVEDDGKMTSVQGTYSNLNIDDLDLYSVPIVLYGLQGCGKTSVVSKLAQFAPQWLGKKVVRIFRSFGMTYLSSTIKNTLVSIIEQIWEIYQADVDPIPVTQLEADMAYLVMYFEWLLHHIDAEMRPMLLVLDAVELLSPADYAHSFQWLPQRLPEHVHVVLSVSAEHDCWQQLQEHLQHAPDFLIQVPHLEKDEVETFVDNYLNSYNRSLTTDQKHAYLDSLGSSVLPLLVRTTIQRALEWRSTTPHVECGVWLCDTMQAALVLTWERLEATYGGPLVQKTLGYLAVSHHGLTLSELEDVLSCDDSVLQHVYADILPPDMSLVRLPQLPWQRLWAELSHHILVLRRADEKDVVAWRQSQWHDAAQVRYAPPPIRVDLHSELADYFLGMWAGDTPKSLVLGGKRPIELPNARRGIPIQTLMLDTCTYNLRKLSELPHSLTHAARFEELMEHIASDFDFIYHKTQAVGLGAVLVELQEAADIMEAQLVESKEKSKAHVDADSELSPDGPNLLQRGDEEDNEMGDYEGKDILEDEELEDDDVGVDVADIALDAECDPGEAVPDQLDVDLQDYLVQLKLIIQTLQLAEDATRSDPALLAGQILGQLGSGPLDFPCLERLQEEVREWAQRAPHPLLLPAAACLPPAGTDVMAALPAATHGTSPVLGVGAGGRVLYWLCAGPPALLRECDLHSAGRTQHMRRLPPDLRADSIRLVGQDRYMYIQSANTDTVIPTCDAHLLDLQTLCPIPLPANNRLVGVSGDGEYCVLESPYTGPVERKPGGTGRRVTLAQLLSLSSRPAAPSPAPSTPSYMPSSVPLVIKRRSGRPAIVHVSVSPDDGHVALICDHRKMYVFAADTGQMVYTWGGGLAGDARGGVMPHEAARYRGATCWASDNELLMPGLDTITARVLYVHDVGKGQVVHELKAHLYPVELVALSPCRTLVASGTTEGGAGGGTRRVHVWRLARGDLMSTVGETGPYSALSFLADPQFVLTAAHSDPEVLSVWYVGSASKSCSDAIRLQRLVSHTADVRTAVVAGGDRTLVTAAGDGVRLWALPNILMTLRGVLDVEGHDLERLRKKVGVTADMPHRGATDGHITAACLTVAGGGRVGAVGTRDGWVIFYDLQTMSELNYHRLDGPVSHMVASSSGKHVLSTRQEALYIWEACSGRLLHTFTDNNTDHVTCLAESSDMVIVGYHGNQGGCRGVLYNLQSGNKIKSFSGHNGFTEVDISSDAKLFVTNAYDRPLVYDVRSVQPWSLGEVGDPATTTASCTCLRFSPDSRYVCACSDEGGVVRIVDLSSRQYAYYIRQRGTARDARFTSDGQLLVTTGDANILVWTLASGRLLYTFMRHTATIRQVSLVCGDRYMVSCADDCQILVWDFERRRSMAGFRTHCPVGQLAVAGELEAVLYLPQTVAYLGVLRPNPTLGRILRGEAPIVVPPALMHAQALALAFSCQKVAHHTSMACAIL